MTRWGVVATIKAPAKDIVAFVAYHLDLGADHIFIYLDNENPKAQAALANHPRVTTTRTNQAYWYSLGIKKPVRHQSRQTANASHAYRASTARLDWIAHIDVDEFLCPKRPVGALLSDIPKNVVCARVRPAEALANEGLPGLDPKTTYCKAWMPGGNSRMELEKELYPTFGGFLRGGFVSHFVGKIFIRTGLPNLEFRIHRGMQNKQEIEPRMTLDDIDLCHCHITGWDAWQKIIDYRMTKGSYRSELKPTRKPELGGMSLHDLFSFLLADGGEETLKAFYEEICLARPELIEKLRKNGVLREFQLDADAKKRKHFPGFS
ncbi:glycosyltransferase family 2 protein [Shimia sp.]|uniref:glycosyltransferase family 2 protein n=1 Tax=Shimia sp. TaxID=1954381 RepID=UPI003298B7BB